ncbi:MAG TPA: hypothetical protein EYQ64_15605, partial [Gemmatimonadetes bacterium]|nr:hypothetical protein [Gemmatimonadota bacterium]
MRRINSRPRVVLLASDLQALDGVAGEHGLRQAHPAKLVLGVRRSDALLAAEFAAELFEAAVAGWRSTFEAPREDLEALVPAVERICLELAARFAADAL